jgi:hypothetical protein
MTKLKKQLIISGVALFLCAVMIGVYFIATRTPDNDEGAEEIRDSFGVLMKNDRHFIVDPVEVKDIKKIRVHNTLDDYTLIHKDNGAWAFEKASGYEPDAELLSTLRTNTRYLLSVEYVENADLENLDKYGIDKANPLVWFELEHTDGSHRVLVGDKTPDGMGYYACLDGRDALYILDNGIENSVLLTLCDYIKPIVADPIEANKSTSLERLSIYRGGDAFLRIDMVKDKLTYGNNSSHRLTYPVSNHAASLANFNTFLEKMSSITCDKTVLFGEFITPEALADLGFVSGTEEHICDYTLTAEYPMQDICLHFVENGDEYLIYSENKNIVVSASKAIFPYLEWELIAWVSSEIYMLDIFDVATIEFTSPNAHALFELSGEEDIIVTSGGKNVSAPDFKAVYQEMMYLLVTDWGQSPENTAELMHITVTLESGEVLDYSFRAASAVNSFYTLNGEDKFYVSREKLLELRSLFESLAGGV